MSRHKIWALILLDWKCIILISHKKKVTRTGTSSSNWATEQNQDFSGSFSPLSSIHWITELFTEYRPSYSDILPMEAARGIPAAQTEQQ